MKLLGLFVLIDLAGLKKVRSRGLGQVPDELCGVYEAPACSAVTANASVCLGCRQTLRPNGSIVEEGAWAAGRCSESSASSPTASIHYRWWGTFRDHGPDPRNKDPGARKLIVDVQRALVTLLPGSPSAVESWKRACPCGGRAWTPFEEVDVIAHCGATCEPFLARSLFLVYSTTRARSLCVSPRRSFDERWPTRQALNLCFAKEADMACSWSLPAKPDLSAHISPGTTWFSGIDSHAQVVAEIPITATSTSVELQEDGRFSESIAWRFGSASSQSGQGYHFRTIAAGRWHHHGAHTFASGLVRLRFELSHVRVSTTSTPVCLEEGCAPTRMVLRLLCPCGRDGWAEQGGGAAEDLLRCAGTACSLLPLVAREAFLLAGSQADSTSCLSPRSTEKFTGWGINNTATILCGRAAPPSNSDEPMSIPEIPRKSATEGRVPEESVTQGLKKTISPLPAETTFSSPVETPSSPVSQPSRSQHRDGVLLFEAAGYAGRHEVASAGMHRLADLGLERVRSMRIPPGWRVTVNAPIAFASGRIISEASPFLRALVFDVANITEQAHGQRPWLNSTGLGALELQLSFEIARCEPATTPGAKLSTAFCGEHGGEVRVLSLFGESSERFHPPAEQQWRSISVDDGYHVIVDRPSRGGQAVVDLLGSAGGTRSCANFEKAPKVVIVEPDCSLANQCSGHGICRRPHHCVCRLMDGWTGDRCDMQVPDRSSSVVCDSIIAFLGVPMQCTIHTRRQFTPVTASLDVISVRLRNKRLGDLQVDTPKANETTISLTFWPRREWEEPQPLFELSVAPSLLADLSGSLVTPVRAMPVPRMTGSCDAHHDLEDGHFSCRLVFSPRDSSTPLRIPLRFVAFEPRGCAVSRLRCAGSDMHESLCSRAAFDVEVFALEAILAVHVRPPLNKHSSTSLARLDLSLTGPRERKASEQATRGLDPRESLSLLGLPRNIPQASWSSSLRLACAGALVGYSPAARLAAGDEAFKAGNARGTLQAVSEARRSARRCAQISPSGASMLSEITIRTAGLQAAVEWYLFGHVEAAREVGAQCLRSARGDADAEHWAFQCRQVVANMQTVQKAIVAALRAAVAEDWKAVLPGAASLASWSEVSKVGSDAVAALPLAWNDGLELEDGATARRWVVELHVAVCLGSAASVDLSANGGKSFNDTMEVCGTTLAVLEIAVARWSNCAAFEAEARLWQLRVQIIRAELFLAANYTMSAMHEVIRAMSSSDDEQSIEHDHLSELLRRIIKARVDRSSDRHSKDRWESEEDEKGDHVKSHYDVLGVARNASDAEVKRAYRQLALKWHPDKHPDKAKAEAMFLSITEAYEYIMSDTTRQREAGQAGGAQRSSEDDNDQKEQADDHTSDEGKDEEQSDTSEDEHTGREEEHDSSQDAGWSFDSLSHVACPRHYCLPGRRG